MEEPEYTNVEYLEDTDLVVKEPEGEDDSLCQSPTVQPSALKLKVRLFIKITTKRFEVLIILLLLLLFRKIRIKKN